MASIIINSDLSGKDNFAYESEADKILEKYGAKDKRDYKIESEKVFKDKNLFVKEIKNIGTIVKETTLDIHNKDLTEIINLYGFDLKSKLFKDLEKELRTLAKK